MTAASDIERLLAQVDVVDGCWLWTGPVDRGHGFVSLGGKRRVRACRLAYEHWCGPAGRTVSQRCGNKRCVNPDHLASDADDTLARFLRWIDVDADALCWVWTGPLGRRGHGRLSDGTKYGNVIAHRYAYERWRGPIPAGLDVVQRCGNKRCVNPDHLAVAGHAAHRVSAHEAFDWAPEHLGDRCAEYDRSYLRCASGHWVLGDNARTRTVGAEILRTCIACEGERLDRLRIVALPETPREALRRRFLEQRAAQHRDVA